MCRVVHVFCVFRTCMCDHWWTALFLRQVMSMFGKAFLKGVLNITPVINLCYQFADAPPPPAFLDLECLEAAKANQNQSWLVLRLEVLNFCIFVYSKHPRSRVYWPSTNKREHYEVCTMRNTKTNINLHYPLDLLRNMEEQFNTQDPTRVLLVTTWCARWYLQCNTIQLNEFWNSGIASV